MSWCYDVRLAVNGREVLVTVCAGHQMSADELLERAIESYIEQAKKANLIDYDRA